MFDEVGDIDITIIIGENVIIKCKVCNLIFYDYDAADDVDDIDDANDIDDRHVRPG